MDFSVFVIRIGISYLYNAGPKNTISSNEGNFSVLLKSGNRNNPYIKKWRPMYYIGTPTFRYTGYFCYLTLLIKKLRTDQRFTDRAASVRESLVPIFKFYAVFLLISNILISIMLFYEFWAIDDVIIGWP